MKTILITLTLVLALAGSASAGFLDFWNYSNWTWGPIYTQLQTYLAQYTLLIDPSNGNYLINPVTNNYLKDP